MAGPSPSMKVDLYVVPPDHALAPFVISVFRLRARHAFAAETIFPKGIVDVLFNFGEPIRASSPGTPTWTQTLIGAVTTAPVLATPAGAVSTMGLALRPEGASLVLGVPLAELNNGHVDGKAVLRDVDVVYQRLGELERFNDQCGVLFEWVARRIVDHEHPGRLAAACRLLRRTGDVSRSADGVGLSSRQLQRVLHSRVGLGPAEYIRLMRFVDALPLVATPRSLTDVAAASGYFDHAHFCRDFRTFSGMTPESYRAARPRIPGHIFA